jgi:hypothetical protein
LPDFLCRSLTGWIDRDLQMELTHCLINSFFLAHLKQDNDAANVVYQAGSILSNVRYNYRICTIGAWINSF